MNRYYSLYIAVYSLFCQARTCTPTLKGHMPLTTLHSQLPTSNLTPMESANDFLSSELTNTRAFTLVPRARPSPLSSGIRGRVSLWLVSLRVTPPVKTDFMFWPRMRSSGKLLETSAVSIRHVTKCWSSLRMGSIMNTIVQTAKSL